MDSEALKTFLAIHQYGGFSNAARQLHRTQPAISRRIALLEQELGAALFERTHGAVVLSQAGRVLLPHAERALATLRDAADAVTALRAVNSGPVSVAMVGTLASTAFAGTARRFAARFPDVGLTLRTATSIEVSDLVRRGEIAIGLRYFEDPSTDVSCTTVGLEKLVVTCAYDHPLARKTVPSLRNLKDEVWFVFPDVPNRAEAAAQTVHAHFLSRGIAPIDTTPVDSLTAQKRLIEAGFGIALLQQSAIKEECAAKTLATINVRDFQAANPVSIVVRKNGYLSAAASHLIKLLEKTRF